jgi:hypothetical protein
MVFVENSANLFFVFWVAFLEWGLDWLQVASRNLPKSPQKSTKEAPNPPSNATITFQSTRTQAKLPSGSMREQDFFWILDS